NDPDLARFSAGCLDLEKAVTTKRQVVLADLIRLRQVRIVVLLAIPLREACDIAVQRHSDLHRESEGFAIHYGQHAGQPDSDWVGLRVWRLWREPIDTARKELRPRQELNVDFKPDNGRVIHSCQFSGV